MKLNINPPDFIYCPFCGNKLEIKFDGEKERKYCLTDNWTYYPFVANAVGAVIRNGDKVLLVKRNKEPYKNTWMFPAGFVDYGEHPEDSLAREVKEETGLDVISSSLMGIFQVDDDPRSPGHFDFFYEVKVGLKNEIKTDKDENNDINWFDLINLPEIGWHTHQKVVDIVRKEV
ncbi:MAG: NUDIX hydrolase [Candidatus Shapirobacteria bacterium]|jgi:ADP-ribose pyrophosphatase YjhB (NUDIX family)